MIDKNIYNSILSQNNFKESSLDTSSLLKMATREGFGEGLLFLGENNQEVVALAADLTESVQMEKFKETFPNRFFEIGVAEQNLVSVASGMAAIGKLPFAASYAAFSPGRNWEQIRTTICYNDRKVVIVGAHAGLSVGPDGGTHQALEDIGLMRMLPNITVLSPSDSIEARELVKLIPKIKGPVYLRLAREKSFVIHDQGYRPEVGSVDIIYTTANIENRNKRVGIISTGPILYQVLLAAKELEVEGFSVQIMNIHTIKPIDKNKIVEFAKNNNKKILTVEEHQTSGGLGSTISEILSEEYPSLVRKVGVKDRYGQSGTVEQLYKEYGLDKESIKEEIKSLVHLYA
ncbi:MAG: Transketolase, central region [Patescibacteria group bacterium]|nr:Transketolase, central region [Patescibacteria group bacterium]